MGINMEAALPKKGKRRKAKGKRYFMGVFLNSTVIQFK